MSLINPTKPTTRAAIKAARVERARPKPTEPIELVIPDDCRPGREDEIVDILYALWVGNEEVLAEHRKAAVPKIRAQRVAQLAAEAQQQVKAAEAEWVQIYTADGPLDEEALVAAAMARVQAVGRHVALSYSPPGITGKHWGHRVATANRYAEFSEWALLMLLADLVPADYENAFSYVAKYAQHQMDQTQQARLSIAPGGSADTLPERRRNAKKLIEQTDSMRKKALAVMASRGVDLTGIDE